MKSGVIQPRSKTVYVVTTGQYSDYRMHSFWSVEKDAIRIVNILNHDKYNHAGYHPRDLDKATYEVAGFQVKIDLTTGERVSDPHWQEGETCVIGADDSRCYTNFDGDEIRKVDGHWSVRRHESYEWGFIDYRDIILCAVFARSETEEQALKIARDRRAVELADIAEIT